MEYNKQYYLYGNSTVEESFQKIDKEEFVAEVEKAVVRNNTRHSDDELAAAVGLMQMHYEVLNVPEITPNNDRHILEQSTVILTARRTKSIQQLRNRRAKIPSLWASLR